MKRGGYICHACRDGLHALCASDLDPKRVCTCDQIWHVEITDGQMRKFKGTTWITERAERDAEERKEG